MILSARPLKDVNSLNSFEISEVFEFTENSVTSVYFQLIDSSVNTASCGFNPTGRRYIPASGSTLQCVVQHVDDAIKITRYAVNPYTDDRSIWKLDFFSTDKIRGTCNLQILLTEGAVTTTGLVKSVFRIYPKSTL